LSSSSGGNETGASVATLPVFQVSEAAFSSGRLIPARAGVATEALASRAQGPGHIHADTAAYASSGRMKLPFPVAGLWSSKVGLGDWSWATGWRKAEALDAGNLMDSAVAGAGISLEESIQEAERPGHRGRKSRGCPAFPRPVEQGVVERPTGRCRPAG